MVVSLALLALLMGAGGWIAWQRGVFSEAQPAAEEVEQAAAPEVEAISLPASGTGGLAAVSEVELGFQRSGVLIEVNVDAGDSVSSGDVLARLQVYKTPAELAAGIASAELAALEAQQALDALYENAALEAAQALADYEAAQQALERVQDTQPELAAAGQDVAAAQQDVEDAEMALYILEAAPSEQAVAIANAALLFKEQELLEMEKQAARLENQIRSATDPRLRDRLKRELMSQNIRLWQMRSAYEERLSDTIRLSDPADEDELTLAQARLAAAQAELSQAQSEWDALKSGPTAGELAEVEAAVFEAQAAWQRLQEGPDPDELALAQAILERAQAALAVARQEQIVFELDAPSDGVVLSVSAGAGDHWKGGTLLTLADLSQPYLEAYFDESDAARVTVGSQAEVVFDVLPDLTFTGQVIFVDPTIAEGMGANALRVLVLLAEAPGVNSRPAPLGMSASIELIE
jgi:multidrug resistance efflux pump